MKEPELSMQRYFSVGTSTLVALMAAHREAANSSKTRPAIFDQAIVAEMNRYLASCVPALDAERPAAAPINGAS
jgi:hypothetical protein